MIQSLIKNTQNKQYDNCPACQSIFITTFDNSKESIEHKCINCKHEWKTPRERN